jgi:hypothetical protein
MKKQLTTLFLLLSLAGFSQTNPGFHIMGTAGTSNVSRDQRMIVTLSPEVMYMGGRLGLGAVYNTTVNLYKDSKVKYHNPKGVSTSVGLKAYGRVFSVDALDFLLTAEVDYIIEPLDKKMASDYIFIPGASVTLPLYKNFGARASYGKTIYRQGYKGEPIWKKRDGGALSLTYKL